jgi:hypothetical protein
MKNLLLSVSLVIVTALPAVAAPKTLDIYFIDVEGGAATLIVTPVGESMLIDSGFAEDRDAQRILHVAKDVAGLRQIDHYITTHWHRDHVGGVTLLAKIFPIVNYYDHGLPVTPGSDVPGSAAGCIQVCERWEVDCAESRVMRSSFSVIRVRRVFAFRILAANALVVGEEAGSPQIKQCGDDFKPIEEDKTDNANSLGMILTYGPFRFFNGGDLTWNVENKLVCPKDLVGPVDLFQVNHHGVANSNNPALVRALKPRVAVIDNGPRKGADPKTFATLKSVRDIEAIYQLHKNMVSTWNDNTASTFIANDDEKCQGEFIKVAVNPNGRSYRVEIPSKKISTNYSVR